VNPTSSKKKQQHNNGLYVAKELKVLLSIYNRGGKENAKITTVFYIAKELKFY
jgi:hypothetical protein